MRLGNGQFMKKQISLILVYLSTACLNNDNSIMPVCSTSQRWSAAFLPPAEIQFSDVSVLFHPGWDWIFCSCPDWVSGSLIWERGAALGSYDSSCNSVVT